MNGGRVEQVGPPEDIYDRPCSRFAAEFIGEASLLPGKVVRAAADGVLVDVGGGLTIAARPVAGTPGAGEDTILMTRPERIELLEDGAAGDARLTIAERIFQGEKILFELATPEGGRFRCAVPSTERYRAMQAGLQVAVRFRECRAIPAGQA